jgi:hypothetical protein
MGQGAPARPAGVRGDDSRSESFKEERTMRDFLIDLLFSGLKKVNPRRDANLFT